MSDDHGTLPDLDALPGDLVEDNITGKKYIILDVFDDMWFETNSRHHPMPRNGMGAGYKMLKRKE